MRFRGTAGAAAPARRDACDADRMLAVRGASVGYNGHAVLDHVSLTVAPGQIHCLLGRNGVGKTTLFRSILGFLPLLSGTVTVDGRDASQLSDRALSHVVAYVPQAGENPFAFSVRDVVALGRLSRMGVFSSPSKGDREVVGSVLARLGIEYLADRPLTELSGGERQMVLIARAVAQEPEYLMMDEPTAALDLGNQAQVLRCARELADSGLGILMTTHDPDQLRMLEASGALIMPDGTYLTGSADELLARDNLERAYGCRVTAAEHVWRPAL